MNFKEAIDNVRQGKPVAIISWFGMAFLRAEYCPTLQVNEELVLNLKTEIFLSVFNYEALQLMYIFQIFLGRKRIYFFDECDLAAEDWEIFRGFKNG